MPDGEMRSAFPNRERGVEMRVTDIAWFGIDGKGAGAEACSQPRRFFLLPLPVFIPWEVQERMVQTSRRRKPAQ